MTDTDEIRPGYFTEFEDGLLVGAHPEAIDEPLLLDVGWFDPTDDRLFPTREAAGIERMGAFVQILAPETDESLVAAPTSTGFFVAIPIPEEWDESHLVVLAYDYGAFAEHTDRDTWDWATGGFDPENRCFFVELFDIGSREFPARLGVVEHRTRETEFIGEGIIETLITEHFREADREREIDGGHVVARSHGLGVRDLGAQADDAANFEIRWDADGPADPELVDTVLNALDEAQPVYEGLAGNPEPRLSTGWFSSVPNYYIEDENTDGTACGNNVAGYYRRRMVGGKAVTCVGAFDHERTTRHELFHAIQHDYGSDRHSWVMEGTARTAENLDMWDVRTNRRPVDLRLTLPWEEDNPSELRQAPYQTELFWVFIHDTLPTQPDLDQLGHVFLHGLETADANAYVQEHIDMGSLREAHWRWVRNAVFDGEFDVDGTYSHDCEPNPAAFLDSQWSPGLEEWIPDWDAVELDGSTLEEDAYEFDQISGLTATIVEFQLPPLEKNHYYEVSYPGFEPNEALLFPEEGGCDQDDPNWAIRHFNDLSGAAHAIANRRSDDARSAYLLIQGPTTSPTSGPVVAVVDGPRDYAGIRFVGPEATTGSIEHNPLFDFYGTLEFTAFNFDEDYTNPTFTWEFDGQELDVATTAVDFEDVEEMTTVEFAIDGDDLCFHTPPDPGILTVTMDLPTPDGEVYFTDSDTLHISPQPREIRLFHEIVEIGPLKEPVFEFDPQWQPGEGRSLGGIAWAPREDDLVQLRGHVVMCDADRSELRSGLNWYDHDTDDLLGDAILSLELPTDLEDAEGAPHPRTFRLEHEDYDEVELVTILPCADATADDAPEDAWVAAPHCPPPFIDFPELIFEPVIGCPDESIDIDCLIQSLDEFGEILEELIRTDLFADVRDPVFPLDDLEQWRADDIGPGLERYVRVLFDDVNRYADALDRGEFVGLVRHAHDLQAELAPRLSQTERVLAGELATTLIVSLLAFGAPGADGRNAWRYLGYVVEDPNPNTTHERASLLQPVRASMLGFAAAVDQVDFDERTAGETVRLATAYGFLTGINEVARTDLAR